MPNRNPKSHESGVIFLESPERTSGSYFRNPGTSAPALLVTHIDPPRPFDHARRQDLIAEYVAGKDWVDGGAGRGRLLCAVNSLGIAAAVIGVEPNDHNRFLMALRV